MSASAATMKAPFPDSLSVLGCPGHFGSRTQGTVIPGRGATRIPQPKQRRQTFFTSGGRNRQRELAFPAGYHNSENQFQALEVGESTALHSYFTHELDISRLDEVHERLWMAGLARPALSLSYQLLAGRPLPQGFVHR